MQRILHRHRRGSALPLVAIGMLSILGIASLSVDMAVLYTRKQEHQNACDAAVLAGAQELPEREAAEQKALETGRKNCQHARFKTPREESQGNHNGWENPNNPNNPANQDSGSTRNGRGRGGRVTSTVGSLPVVGSVLTGISNTGGGTQMVQISDNEIIVDSEEEVPLGFGRVFGRETAIVRGHAKAIVQSPNAVKGIRPWAIDDQQPLNFGQTVILKVGGDSDEHSCQPGGNFGIVELEGRPGAPPYIQSIVNGGSRTYRVGEWLTTQPGNMVGPTRSGVSTLLQLARQSPWSGQTWETVTTDNPRLILVPIVDWDQAGSGRSRVQIKGFAAFYVIGTDGGEVTGTFVRHVRHPNAMVDPSAPEPEVDAELQVIRLVE